MSVLLHGFTDELLTLGKEAAPRAPALSPEQLAVVKRRLGSAAKGTLGTALLYKLISPDVPISSAVASGGALVGGGALGRLVGRKAGLGSKYRMAASLGGSVAALRALGHHRKAKRNER